MGEKKKYGWQWAAAVVLVSALVLLWYVQGERVSKEVPRVSEETEMELPREEDLLEVKAAPVVEVKEQPIPTAALISGVPFTVQAPFGEWSDPIFQDACEEASVTMAAAWVKGSTLSKETAKKDIMALAKFQQKIYGHAVDTSIDDTALLLRDYFSVTTFQVQRAVTIPDMRQALAAGNIVTVPTDGRKLKNPNFTQPGPPRHMLVVIGYDDVTEEFIVNDPGTRRGEGYRYPQSVLYEALLDYPTGQHAEVVSTDKVMLTVRR